MSHELLHIRIHDKEPQDTKIQCHEDGGLRVLVTEKDLLSSHSTAQMSIPSHSIRAEPPQHRSRSQSTGLELAAFYYLS